MFEFFKNLFVQKPAEDADFSPEFQDAQPIATPPSAPTAAAATRPGSRPVSNGNGNGNGNGVQVPLQAILSGLPLELKGRIRLSEVGDAVIAIPLEKILSQLSSGSVRIY